MWTPKENLSLSASSIAEKVNGKLLGDPNCEVRSVSPIDSEQSASLTFLTSGSNADCEALLKSELARVVLHSSTSPLSGNAPKTGALIEVEEPFCTLIALIPEFFMPLQEYSGIHPSAIVSPSATIGKDVTIGPAVIIGEDVQIDDGCQIHPHTVIYKGSRLGKNVVLHARVTIREYTVLHDHVVIQSGTVIGSDGFGYVPNALGELVAVPQVGTVEIGPKVEIGANSCIDRGAFGKTFIAEGTKIDNLVQVGHNVQIGKHSILCGQVGVAGSTKIGSRVTLGGQVGTADHVTIGDGVRVGGKGGVHSSLPTSGDYIGNPARPKREYFRELALLRKLPQLVKTLKKDNG